MEAVVLFVVIGLLVFAVVGRQIGNKPRSGNVDAGGERPVAPFDATRVDTQAAASILNGSAYVVDGDTIVIRKTQIRVFGVDAPEMDHPYGKKAKWALVSLCKGQTIRAEITDKDSHGRTVA